MIHSLSKHWRSFDPTITGSVGKGSPLATLTEVTEPQSPAQPQLVAVGGKTQVDPKWAQDFFLVLGKFHSPVWEQWSNNSYPRLGDGGRDSPLATSVDTKLGHTWFSSASGASMSQEDSYDAPDPLQLQLAPASWMMGLEACIAHTQFQISHSYITVLITEDKTYFVT